MMHKPQYFLTLFLFLAFNTACEDENAPLGGLTQAERDDLIIQEYLQENGIEAQRTESGIYYVSLAPGDPASGLVPDFVLVEVHYEGSVLYGDIFDSSYLRGETFKFQSGSGILFDRFDDNGNPVYIDCATNRNCGVVNGWPEAVSLMRRGEKMRFFMPSGLVYGPTGSTNPNGAVTIPPNAVVVFDMELIHF